MRRAATTLLLALLLAGAQAQAPAGDAGDVAALVGWLAGSPVITGGLRATLHDLTLEASLEQPLYQSADGWRAGGLLQISGHTDLASGSLTARAGVTATIPLAGLALQAQLLWREVFATGLPTAGGPELVLVFAHGF